MQKRSVHSLNANQESGKKDTVWVFLAEYSLNEFMRLVEGRGKPVAGLLFRDLGIPQEYQNPITRTLTDFAQQAMMYVHSGTPAVIRLFCQEKILKAGNPAEPMRLKPTVASPEIILQAHLKMSGGWGYFLVERREDFPEDRPANSPNFIDLYLYKEGK